MKIRLGLLLIVFTIIACNSNMEEKPIAKEDFVNLLIDLHFFDAISADYTLNSEMNAIDSATLYSSILYKYSTNKKEFETTMRWYTNHPDQLSEIYDEVFSKLEMLKESINKKTRLFNEKDNVKIWTDTKYHNYKGDSIKYPEPYIIAIKDTGTYLFDIRVRMLTDDKSEDPFLNIFFSKDKIDSIPEDQLEVIRTPLQKSNFTRDYQYIFKLEDDSFKYINIILPDTPDRGKRKKHTNF